MKKHALATISDDDVRPFVDIVMKAIQDQQEMAEQSGKGIAKPSGAFEKECEGFRREFTDYLKGVKDQELLRNGFETVLLEAKSLSNYNHIMGEVVEAGKSLMELPIEGSTPEVYNTFQEAFGFSDDTMSTLYDIGLRLFNENNLEKATGVFFLLTKMNTFLFEPWLALGMCHQNQKSYGDALYSYAMASLLDFDNPSPHLCSAECYIAVNNDQVGREALDLAIAVIDANDISRYQGCINAIRCKLRRG